MANQTMLDAPSELSPYIHSPAPTAIILPLLALFTMILDAPCLIWHISNRNLPASLLVGWVILKNAFAFTNALIWPTDDIADWWDGQIYCDTVVKLDFAASSAIIASTLCIMRALALALDTNRPVMMSETGSRRRHNILVYLLCVGLPVYEMVAAFIVQPARYYILAISGCAMAQWKSLVLVFLCYVPLAALVLATVCYAILVLVRLRRYKQDLASVLASTDSGLSKSRFMRLLGLSLLLMFVYTPLFVYMILSEVGDTLFPFSWSVVHNPSTFKEIILVRTYGVAQLETWTRITIGLVVFACFGFGKDIKKTYRGCLERLGLARFFPNLWLDENDPRNTKRRQQSNGYPNPTLSSSYPNSRWISRTKKWMVKLSSSSSVTAHSTSARETSATGSAKAVSPVKSQFTPSTPTNRPSGLLEQDLFESGDITFDNGEVENASAATAFNQAIFQNSNDPAKLSESERVETLRPATVLGGNWFSRLCERYALGMSQRPQEFFSPGLRRYHAPALPMSIASTRTTTCTEPDHIATTGSNIHGTHEQKAMKYNAYDDYVLSHLA